MNEPTLQKARLIPISGIGSVAEAEQRATSALLAVLAVVRDFSIELLSPMGASKAQKAAVENYIEVTFQSSRGKRSVRPDGLVTVTWGRNTWSSLVEVKTGDNTLEADQINDYWDIARENNIDHILTISNEIAPSTGQHPIDGLKVRANSIVGVSHRSWTAIISTAIRIKRYKGVSDPEQAWLLDELIRYLEHPQSGALAFSDMGSHWVNVRDGARKETLNRSSEGIEDIVNRWDQLVRFAALELSSEIGDDVDPVFPRGQRDGKKRTAALVDSLCNMGVLSGGLRIPNTAGDLDLITDIEARKLSIAIELNAPQDRGARGRVSWLLNQIGDAHDQTMIEAFAKNARTGTVTSLAELKDDRSILIGDEKREPHRFRISRHGEMGMARRAGGKSPSFIDTVLVLINTFYGEVVQNIAPWQPRAPRIAMPEPEPETVNIGNNIE